MQVDDYSKINVWRNDCLLTIQFSQLIHTPRLVLRVIRGRNLMIFQIRSHAGMFEFYFQNTSLTCLLF